MGYFSFTSPFKKIDYFEKNENGWIMVKNAEIVENNNDFYL